MAVHWEIESRGGSCVLSVSEKAGAGIEEKISPPRDKKCAIGAKLDRIVRAAGSLIILADGSPVKVIQWLRL